MAVLPALSRPSCEAFSSSSSFVEEDALARLRPFLLPYWFRPVWSEMRSEMEARAALIETHLLCLSRILWQHNTSLRALLDAAADQLVRDEAIERGLLSDDATHLTERAYIDFTLRASRAALERWESVARNVCVADWAAAAGRLVAHEEGIHRLHIATQFLDSHFLKLCQTTPGWVWRHAARAMPTTTTAPTPKQTVCETEEADTRHGVETIRWKELCIALDVRVAAEKRLMHANARRFRDGETVQSVLHQCATQIQAVFRGYRVRRCGKEM